MSKIIWMTSLSMTAPLLNMTRTMEAHFPTQSDEKNIDIVSQNKELVSQNIDLVSQNIDLLSQYIDLISRNNEIVSQSILTLYLEKTR